MVTAGRSQLLRAAGFPTFGPRLTSIIPLNTAPSWITHCRPQDGACNLRSVRHLEALRRCEIAGNGGLDIYLGDSASACTCGRGDEQDSRLHGDFGTHAAIDRHIFVAADFAGD